MNAYGKQIVDKSTAERLEKSILKKGLERRLPSIRSGGYLATGSVVGKYLGTEDTGDAIIKLENRGKMR